MPKFILKVDSVGKKYHFRILVRETGELFMQNEEDDMSRLPFWLSEVERLNNPDYVSMGNPYAKASMYDTE